VTVGLLERLGDHLVEVHGQHEHQRLLEPACQLDLLDRFGEAEPIRERVAGLFDKYRAGREAVERLTGAERDRAQRLDLLRFQISELDAARLRSGEEEELRTERRRLQNAEKFAGGLAEAQALLADDRDAAAGRLVRAGRLLRDLGRLDPEFAAPAEALDAASAQIEDALLAIRSLRARVEPEPGRLDAIDERLDALTRLKRKYGDTEAAMLAFREDAVREADRLERHQEVLAEEALKLDGLHAELRTTAAELGETRRKAAARLGPAIQREIRALGMERARFEIAVEELAAEAISGRGLEQVEFRFSANPGEELRPLARIASGGELSRTMLAVQVVLSTSERVPTMVFDEVDAGVGGRTAGVVGEKLAAVGAGRQVLCVTHLPQIAARAHHHLSVAKGVRGGRTRAGVAVLAGAERIEEIARMLAGAEVTDTARRHARELLAASPRP
ncbi:MAG: DNA repair protein RecN, partial [Candidatus Rokubacteria bacterium]|nr:DNA repair protein RecN [Candidatus Rokubacteria bacterium]